MHVFANGFRASIPSLDKVNDGECEGVYRGGDGNSIDPRGGLEAGQAGTAPHEVCDTNEPWDLVGIAVKDDWGHIQSHVERIVLQNVLDVTACDYIERKHSLSMTVNRICSQFGLSVYFSKNL
ncbi:hypothetical protein TWF281_001150 [Arthrobotrys megalospora]